MPDGAEGADLLGRSGQALEFLRDQYRHCKPMLLIGASGALLTQAGITAATPSDESDPGLLQIDREQLKQGLQSFVDALTRHRIFERETDPPAI